MSHIANRVVRIRTLSVVAGLAVTFSLVSSAQAQWGALGSLLGSAGNVIQNTNPTPQNNALGTVLGVTGQIVQDDYNSKQANYWNEEGRTALAQGNAATAAADFTRSLGYVNDPNVQGNLVLANSQLSRR
jgi:hypothetical protein